MSNSASLPEQSHFIPLSQAIEMTTLYRQQKETILVPALRGQGILPVCETFNRAAFDFLLAEQGCVGLRFYYGMSADLKVHIIAVGVNDQNEDMLPDGNSAKASATDLSSGDAIVEDSQRCPDLCPPPSLLNS